MKEQLLDHIHQALSNQLNELTTFYEQQIAKLQHDNTALKTKVYNLEKQLASLRNDEKKTVAAKTKISTSEKQPASLPKETAKIENKPVELEVKADTSEKQLTSLQNNRPIVIKKPAAIATVSLKKPHVHDHTKETPKPKHSTKASKSKGKFSLHNFHIIHEADLKFFLDEYQLEEREIAVLLFDVEGVEETNQTVQLRAYVNREQTEAFILEQAFKAEQALHKPYRLLGSRKHYSLDWPTNHILQKEGSLKRYLNLSPASELDDFGYQVRTLSKEERWAILQNAVPIIGLKKAADTIANHIHLRKSQENGEQFYANAISKWQYDLARLKKHYYKKDFTWPG